MAKRLALVMLVLAIAIGACLAAAFWRKSPGPTTNVPSPVPEVGVVTVQPAEIPLPVEYAGRVIGFRDVEVRPLVSGVLLRREFDEGARVEQGQVLFRIDPATYEVALKQAEAQLQQARATLRKTEADFARIDELSRRGVATERQRDEALSERDQARGSVQLAEAQIAGAKLNLDYTTVAAPVTGVSGLQSPAIGTLVLAQQTLLTTITQLDPAYVSFSFTDEEGQAFRAQNELREKPLTAKDFTVELQFGNGRIDPTPGSIDVAAQRVDPQTGTIQARAVFPNRDGSLLPGQFVRVLIRGATLPDAIVIPKQAVIQGVQGPSVFVVGENGIAQARPIRLGKELTTGWIVQDGLKGGEQVIVDGVIRTRPGAPVKAVPFSAPATERKTPASVRR